VITELWVDTFWVGLCDCWVLLTSHTHACHVLADMRSVDGWGSIPRARSVMGRGWSLLQSRERCRLTICLLRTWQACVLDGSILVPE